jgi:hypothetical protein
MKPVSKQFMKPEPSWHGNLLLGRQSKNFGRESKSFLGLQWFAGSLKTANNRHDPTNLHCIGYFPFLYDKSRFGTKFAYCCPAAETMFAVWRAQDFLSFDSMETKAKTWFWRSFHASAGNSRTRRPLVPLFGRAWRSADPYRSAAQWRTIVGTVKVSRLITTRWLLIELSEQCQS